MRVGLALVDITPRTGLEMSGFGPYIHRVGTEIRDRLYARAMAVEEQGARWVLVSCDLVGVGESTVGEARRLVAQAVGLSDQQVMIHCIHTHSAPASVYFIGWGELDAPYMTRLPKLIAQAAVKAVQGLDEASISYAEAPAEHIAYNRDTEQRPAFADAMKESWEPAHPELTDRMASVMRVDRGRRMAGFLSSFSCHPVVCCEETHSVHGDFVGVATNLVQREHPGSVGLFLQGGHGDINVAVCHQPQEPSLQGLDVMAHRYLDTIHHGLQKASPMHSLPVASVLERVTFTREHPSTASLRADIAMHKEKLLADPQGDASFDGRLHTVFKVGLEKVLADFEARGSFEHPVDMQAFRVGDLKIVGTPFELYRGIKERLRQAAHWDHLLVLSMCNESAGYAVTKERFGKASYTARQVPLMTGAVPYTPDLEDQIVDVGLKLLARLGD